MNKLQKYLKLVSQKLGTLQFPNPSGLGFQVKKLLVTNLKVRKKNFHILACAFFTRTTLICCTNVLPILTNLTQCFTKPVYQLLPINCEFIITNHSIGYFLHNGSQCFTNHQFTSSTGKFTNSCQWFTIGSYCQ